MGSPEEDKFHIGLFGGVFATQPIGREILLRLARHIIAANKIEHPPIKDLLNRAVLHIVPGVDPNFDKIPYSCNPSFDEEIGKKLYSRDPSHPLTDVVTTALDNILENEGYDALILLGGGSGVTTRYFFQI